MKSFSLLMIVAAGPALAHGGAHVHPHAGASWMVVLGVLALVAMGARMAYAQAKVRK